MNPCLFYFLDKTMIRLKDVSFGYEEETEKGGFLLSNLDLHIKKAEYVALTGENGSGKTTLAMLIKGLLSPLSGKVFFDGEDMTASGINQRVGFLLSSPEEQIVSSIVDEDVAFGPENQGMDSVEIGNAVRRSLKRSGISHLRRDLTHLLSGGEQQKVTIAGILAMDVSCIIFDEAASMLDPVSRKEIFKLLKELNRGQGITIIHITHCPEEILSADRVVVLKKGRVCFDDAPEAMLRDDALLNLLGLNKAGTTQFIRGLQNEGIISGRDMKDMDSLVEAICSYKMSEK